MWNHLLRYLFSLPITPSKHRAYLTTQLSIVLGRALPAARSDYPPVSLLLSNMKWQYRNFYLLSIDYVFRPRLRPRLTQGRSALPWKPWIFGRKDSHLPLATHSGILSSIQSTAPSGTASSCMQCSSTDLLLQIPELRWCVSAPDIFGAGPLD